MSYLTLAEQIIHTSAGIGGDAVTTKRWKLEKSYRPCRENLWRRSVLVPFGKGAF
jgi:hypothetical protein